MSAANTSTTTGLARLRMLVVLVVAVSVVAISAVVLLQVQEHDARAKESRARVYSTSINQSIVDLVPVGYALAEREPALLTRLIKGAVDRAFDELDTIRDIDDRRTLELERLVTGIRDQGIARTPVQQQARFAEVTQASLVADAIARQQHDRAVRAERRALFGSGFALAFAIFTVFVLVLRERRRSLADAAAHTDVVRRLADHDSLTELPNRRRFDADLEALDAGEAPVEIAVCDLNGFKEINDRLGHDAGDAVLITVARDLQSAVGDAGTVYRTGGDEFCVVSTPGVRVADLAREAFERDGSTTVGSVGAASFPTDHTVVREVVRLADRRMYGAKHAVAGRPAAPRR